jgi:hypothetical protein
VTRLSISICLYSEQGTPSNARFIPVRAIFAPILLLQVVAVFFAFWRFFERLLLKLQDGVTSDRYISVSSKIDELFMLVQHGSRFYMLSIFIYYLRPLSSVNWKLHINHWSSDWILILFISTAIQAHCVVH